MTYTRRLRCAVSSGSSLGDCYATATSGGNTITSNSATWTSMESTSAIASYRAYPSEGFQFYGWMNDDNNYESYDREYTLNHANTISLMAVFLKVNVCKIVYDANGGTGAPATQTYEQATTSSHTFTISSTTPTKSGYTFVRWIDNNGHWHDPGSSVTLAYNETLTLTAYWVANPTITISAGSGGTVSTSSITVAYGSSISVSGSTMTVDGQTVTATPNTGYNFSSWGNTSGLVTSDRTVTASFSVKTFTVTISAGSGGSVSPTSVSGVPYGSSISKSYNRLTINGTTVTATANTNYSFSSWSNATGTVTANRTITANFTYNPPTVYHTITSSAGTGGSVSPSGATSVAEGGSKSFTASPSSGYRFSHWLVDGSNGGSNMTYTFSNVTADHTIEAVFEPDVITVTVRVAPEPASSYGGTRSGYINLGVGGEQTHVFTQVPANSVLSIITQTPSVGALDSLEGGSGQIQCYPEAAYDFYRFEDANGNALANGTTLTDGMVIVAKFKLKQYTITPSVNQAGYGTISPDTAQTVDYGSSKTFTATPSAGYRFKHWLVDGVIQTDN